MFTTSLAVFAISSLATLGANASPAWQTDYRSAVQLAHAQHKPLAVFVAKTKDDVLRLMADETRRVLQQEYIALLVTTDTPAGQKLASQLELTEGLVISDRSGDLQAFRTPIPPTAAELPQLLKKYSDPNRIVTTTECPVQVVSTAPSTPAVVASTPAPSPVGVYPAAVTSAPVITPTFAVPSNCPSCRQYR